MGVAEVAGMNAVFHCDPNNLCEDCRKRLAGELVEGLKPVVTVTITPGDVLGLKTDPYPAPSKCDCTQLCMKRLRGDDRHCEPKEYFFSIARVRHVKGPTVGEVDRDDIFFPPRYSNLRAALEVVQKLIPCERYLIEDTPRLGMGPAWSGTPEKAEAEL